MYLTAEDVIVSDIKGSKDIIMKSELEHPQLLLVLFLSFLKKQMLTKIIYQAK
ncbi:hypothetical protein SAMN05444372_11076 [Flavobacterium micromati]|uniref:Uncharacterized protein n=1 Tax=Flavobacterium micromati TaxID=229205 RepID=A0A1M5MXC1_9FLAO|nr:hypothetical protein SAMN05444372_11076 [Flavobacterium micromati]